MCLHVPDPRTVRPNVPELGAPSRLLRMSLLLGPPLGARLGAAPPDTEPEGASGKGMVRAAYCTLWPATQHNARPHPGVPHTRCPRRGCPVQGRPGGPLPRPSFPGPEQTSCPGGAPCPAGGHSHGPFPRRKPVQPAGAAYTPPGRRRPERNGPSTRPPSAERLATDTAPCAPHACCRRGAPRVGARPPALQGEGARSSETPPSAH